jgi:hypothetical protein
MELNSALKLEQHVKKALANVVGRGAVDAGITELDGRAEEPRDLVSTGVVRPVSG